MSYKVLARKWRPKDFTTVINQKHVVTALVNALDNNRLHHAYLFSGTRGVGKTTIARVFAKALSCEVGISSSPCGKCINCQELDQGRYMDLLEVDAASRTGVDDTRELLENVQYAPGRGRYKIYLIDEVHMFSKSSFNALLKTLEEPPQHVIFLLATTDPEKLPVTVLSRCLQFNLTRVNSEEIDQYLATVLAFEKIEFEAEAVKMLAAAADGSVRDGLSLLDQAIVLGAGKVNKDAVALMLGSIEHRHIENILTALGENDVEKLMRTVENISLYSTELQKVLDALAKEIHQLAILQMTDQKNQEQNRFEPETLQLYYQIAIKAKQDLALAPDPRTGLEMGLIRMLAFTPETTKKKTKPAKLNRVEYVKSVKLINDWESMVEQLGLSGLALELARNCSLDSVNDQQVSLNLAQEHQGLVTDKAKARLATALANWQAVDNIRLKLNLVDKSLATPAQKHRQRRQILQANAEESIENDPHVQDLIKAFDATVDKDSIQHNN